MSARLRAGSTPRTSDDYPTPPWAFLAVLPHLLRLAEGALGAPARFEVLEPACGEGTLLGAMLAAGLDAGLSGVELRSEAAAVARERYPGAAVLAADFLATTWAGPRPHLVVTNPPYGGRTDLPLAFLKRGLQIVQPGGVVALLLRMNWYGDGRASGRGAWLLANPPAALLQLNRRPSFTEDGKSDASTYAWGVWRSQVAPRGSLLPASAYELVDCAPEAINLRLRDRGLRGVAEWTP